MYIFFVILKIFDNYFVIQSYKNQYSIYDKEKSIKKFTKDQILSELKKFFNILSKNQIDVEYVDIWKNFTHVDVSQHIGQNIYNTIVAFYLFI